MHVTVLGTGYVGLVTGACIADSGQPVVCADIDEAKVVALRAGYVPFFEPGLAEIVQRNQARGLLAFTTDLAEAVRGAAVVFVAVGTPSLPDGRPDLRGVEAVVDAVVQHASAPTVLVLKSTVPVGTNAVVRGRVAGCAVNIDVVSNPEFLKEGSAVEDFRRPDRVVIGLTADDALARERLERLYAPFTLRGNQVLYTDPASAELIKYVANTMLAMRISFMNEVAALAELTGADIHAIRRGVGSDSRIGGKFLYAGPGYGGSCFPKDVKALVARANELGLELELASATERVNERQKRVLFQKATALCGGSLTGRRVTIWGVSFKPQTDDIRESPALTLIDELLDAHAVVVAHDPEALPNLRARYGDRVRCEDDMYAACVDADALLLVTEWSPYTNPEFDRILRAMRTPVVIDGRNLWSARELPRLGFRYAGIGVATSPSPAIPT